MIQPVARTVPVLIVGGGSAGISVAARLARALPAGSVTVVDPAQDHYYQPLWTLVGGGDATRESTRRREADVIPAGVQWIQQGVREFLPDEDQVILSNGERLGYEQLVVALGIQLDWEKIPGLTEALGKDGVCSNYSWETVESTWRFIQAFQGGSAHFTHPNTPIKCGGAPQKIMYLAAEHWEKRGVKQPYDVRFRIASPKIFAVERYAQTLLEVVARHKIDVAYQRDLVALRAASKEAVYKDLVTGAEVIERYEFMHVTPPMSAPDVIKQSPLAASTGWVEVDKGTTQHVRYPNVFSLGDCSNLPTSKTGAAIRKQAPTTAQNILDVRAGRKPSALYNGYTSCPLVTGYGKLVLAEFDYDGKAQETFPFDQSKERWSMYQLKKRLLPVFYWSGMLKGRA
ncbi:MAG: FAD/NAD(P)-binding oxidoreductase [Planctomycetota bacterium]